MPECQRRSRTSALPRDLATLDPADPDPELQRLVADWLQLHGCLQFQPATARELLVRHARPGRAWRAGARLAPLSAVELAARRAALARSRVRLLPWGSPAYPEQLARLPDAPPLLFARGWVSCLAVPSVAIVGPRAPSAYGRSVARRLADELARTGIAVVSGLARGVDAVAHEAALAAGGVTVAVQGCGPDQVYPPEHAALAERIAERGAVLSELAPGAPPLAHHFPLRNRIISGLAQAVVVIEARVRSGSLVTARLALDQGVEVLAVPGPIDRPTSEGSNRLIRDGAAPVLEVEDVLARLSLPRRTPCSAATLAQPAVGGRSGEVLVSLAEAPASRDELERRLGWPAGEIALALLELELRGLVAVDRDGRLRPAAP